MKLYRILAVIFIVLSIFLVKSTSFLFNNSSALKGAATNLSNCIENDLKLVDKDITALKVMDENILDSIASQRDVIMLMYETDQLIFWTSREVLPYYSEIFHPDLSDRFITHKNGDYVLRRYQLSYNRLLAVILPIKKHYTVDNQYLKERMIACSSVNPSIVLQSLETKYPVIVKGKKLFFLDEVAIKPPFWFSIFLFWLYLFTWGVAVWLVFQTSDLVKKRWGVFWQSVFLLGSVIVIRALSVYFELSSNLSVLSIFEPQQFSQWPLGDSVGDLWINASLAFLLSFFFVRTLPKNLEISKPTHQYLIIFGYYLLIVFSIVIIDKIINLLVVNTNISFELHKIYALNLMSLLGLIIIMILNCALFSSAYKLFYQIYHFRVQSRTRAFLMAVAFVCLMLLYFFVTKHFNISLIIFSVIFMILYDVFIKNQKHYKFEWMVIWLLFFSLFSFFTINHYRFDKKVQEKLAFAKGLAEKHNTDVEKSLNQLAVSIVSDDFIKQYLDPFGISVNTQRSRVISKIRYLFEEENILLNRFEIKNIDVFDANQLKSSVYLGYLERDSIYNSFQEVSKINGRIRFGIDQYLNKNYTLKILIYNNLGVPIGVVFLDLNYNQRNINTLYPELLISEKISNQMNTQFDYAVFKDHKFVGGINLNPSIEFPDFEGRTNQVLSTLKYHFLKFQLNQSANDYLVIVHEKELLVNSLSLFSYLFCLYLIVLGILCVIGSFTRWIPFLDNVSITNSSSLKGKIQMSVMTMIILSFLAIAFVTVVYFTNSSDKYLEQRLERKTSQVFQSTQYLIDEYSSSIELPDIQAIANINSMDIDLYGLDGKLISSSQENIYRKGLIAPLMPYGALATLENRDISIQEEQIGDLKFRSAYIPLKYAQQNIAFLGIPYYTKETSARSEVTDFISALLNVYVLLLLAAGLITIFISNSITKPLSLISDKMQQMQLGKRNEPIVWQSSDEIGQLIAQYNQMIEELDTSAEKLADNERESAWREMAKQVAHEIKNPLTPMKLNIQLLQRMAQDNPEMVKERIAKVGDMLIEQIDNLSSIASEFSDFAKMPIAKLEIIALNQILTSTYDLYRSRSGVQITLDMPAEDIKVMGDRNHLLRVMSNLVKNAYQAMDETRNGEVSLTLSVESDKIAMIKVADNGVGIADEMKENIFRPNFTTKNSGTGIGLSISKKIIEQLDGKIYFDSKINEGTTFVIELPMVDN